MAPGPSESEIKKLREQEGLLQAVNQFARWLVGFQTESDAAQKSKEEIDNQKSRTDEYKTAMTERETDAKAQRADLAQRKAQNDFVVPQAQSMDSFMTQGTVEEYEARVAQLNSEKVQLSDQLNPQSRAALGEFEAVMKEQFDVLTKTNAYMEESQESGVLLLLHDFHEEAKKSLKNPETDLNALLLLHNQYCQLFENGQNDPNNATRDLFIQVESGIQMAFHNELLKPGLGDKMSLLTKVMANIDPSQQGSSTLRDKLIPILEEFQRKIPRSEFEKLSKFKQQDITKFLKADNFQGMATTRKAETPFLKALAQKFGKREQPQAGTDPKATPPDKKHKI